MSLQAEVVEAVRARGYFEGWELEQLLVRQLVKAIEELGELATLAVSPRGEPSNEPMCFYQARYAGEMARFVFDLEPEVGVFSNTRLRRAPELEKEIADVVIPLMIVCGLAGIDLEAAVRRAVLGDVPRGVRKAK